MRLRLLLAAVVAALAASPAHGSARVGVATVAAPAAAPANRAAPRLGVTDARSAASAYADLAAELGGRLRVERCTRFGPGRVDCALREAPGDCAIVASVRRRATHLQRELYACPPAAEPTAAQRAAARTAEAVATYRLGCLRLLSCPPGYGPRPDERALLLPSASLLAARPPSPRPVRTPEADVLAAHVAAELNAFPVPGSEAVQWAVRDCRRLTADAIQCELGDWNGGPACMVTDLSLRADGWLAAAVSDCAGRPAVAAMIERRTRACTQPRRGRDADPACRPPWTGTPAYIPVCRDLKCPAGSFERVRVCWRLVVRGKRTTRCSEVRR